MSAKVDNGWEQELEGLSSTDWSARLASLKSIGNRLRVSSAPSPPEALNAALSQLTTDPKWEIRRELALLFSDVSALQEIATEVLDPLAKDGNRWVRDAASRALRTRARSESESGGALTRISSQPHLAYVTKLINQVGARSLTPQIVHDLVFQAGDHFYRELAADTAHEVRTLLTPLYGYCDKLREHVEAEGWMDELSETYHRAIENRLEQLLLLTEQIALYAAQESEPFEPARLVDLVEDALDIALESALSDIDTRVDVAESIEVEVRPGRFRQALVNIMKNAVEAMPGGGELRVAAHEERASAVITVADTGEGMSDEQLQSAFRRFRTTKRRRGGTGLGLPIADRIIHEEHGGEIAVTSRRGSGTVVEVRFPRKEATGE